MTNHNQPPAKAVADLPVTATVIAAFASVAGQPGLLLQAAKGAIALLAAGLILVLILPATAASSFFLVFVSFAATSHFGLNWCRVMLLGPAGLPARSLGWTAAHWRFLGYGLLLFLVMLLSTLPMTAIGSVLAALLGLAAAPGEMMGARVGLVMLLTFLGMIYVLARFGFIFPAVAMEENYSLRHAWQHTGGQGLRMTAALFAAGFPLALAQLLLTVVLFEGVLGVSLSEVMAPPGPDTGEPSPAEVGGAAPSLAAVLFVNAVAALFNFLCFAVLFSLLSLAFRTCTGWVPAVSGPLPSVPENRGDDDAR